MKPAEIPVRTVWLLLAGFLGAVLLNVHHAALWCMPLALGVSIWRARRLRAMPGKSRWLARAAVIAVPTVAVFIGFRTLNGVQAGASLLIAMGALKLTETSAPRDWLILVGASLFLLLAACLDAQMLWRMPLYAAELGLLCMGMYALGAGDAAPSLPVLGQHAARSMLIAMPLALLLFLFVPRIAGSFWTLPQSHEAVTGLSEQMNPGNISQLSISGEPVARVRFNGTIPPPEQRYWRGFVLDKFDGNNWTRARHPYELLRTTAARSAASNAASSTFRYEISLEPTHINVLIALEMPRRAPDAALGVRLSDDYQLLPDQPVNDRMNYRIESSPDRNNEDTQLTEDEKKRYLEFPKAHNLRSISLAHLMRTRADNDLDYIRDILDYFHRGGFKYALDPELSNSNSVDDLLFNTRQGFCGHYASAFVQLMRAANIPARVVTGYQGGIWNRYGNYLLIRQSDAHAWSEVWLEGLGWRRVDPTSVVAPERLTRGPDELSSDESSLTGRVLSSGWISDTLQAWQAANAWWQDQVVGFNFSKQQDLLRRLGIQTHYLRALTVLLAIGGSIWLAIIAWTLRPQVTERSEDTLSRSWLALERKLQRAAPPRALHEGPVAYAERVGRTRPDIASTIGALARRYAQLRYGPKPKLEDVEQFRRDVRLLPAVAAPSKG